ncbi:MAG: LacI family DNA-binding transcriptional regulator [Filimonas sp.]|nr:LacI family DNA-binding transcriptional regulator [Filimonas sp.]
MQKKLPTIKEIAKRLNVSVSTVSRALHDHHTIGLRTKMQVKALAKELNYEPNQTAIMFKQRKTFIIGVITPRLTEEFFSTAISGIEDVASKNKYNVLIAQSYDDSEREQQIVETMKNSRVDGLLVSVAKNTKSTEHFDALKKYNIPVVFFDCVPEQPDLNSVSCDLHTGTIEAVNFLAAKGHKRIALLNGPANLPASNQREKSFIEGLEKNKLKADPALIVETDLSKESTYAAVQSLLDLKSKPTAVVVFNDYVALETMQYAKSKKIRINKDISFVSYAHLPVCNYLDNPPLASVEQFPYEQGSKAMDLLFNILSDTNESRKPEQIILDSKLMTWGD